MSDPTVVIAGDSGFIGQTLASALDRKGYEVIILTRNAKTFSGTRHGCRVGRQITIRSVAPTTGGHRLAGQSGRQECQLSVYAG